LVVNRGIVSCDTYMIVAAMKISLRFKVEMHY